MSLLQSSHWPFLVDVYFFLGGLAGGAFVIATVANLVDTQRYRDVSRIGYYLALAALLPCPILLIVDLGVPSRFVNMLLNFNPQSPMSMGSWALGAFGVCTFLAALFTLLEDLHRARDLSNMKLIVGVIGGFFGFFVAAYPGVLLGATAQPLWRNSHALGALFLAVGASTAAAAMGLLLALGGRAAGAGGIALRRMTVLSLLIQILAVVVFMVSVQGSGSPASGRALALLTSGAFSLTFWAGAIVIGTVVPLLLGLADLRRPSFALSGVGAALVLLGGFLVKSVIMAGGQAGAPAPPARAAPRRRRRAGGEGRMPVLDPREEWADVLRRRERFATSLAPYGVIIDAWAIWEPAGATDTMWRLDECARCWRDGVPLLGDKRFDLAAADVEDLMASAMEAVTAVRPDAAATMRRLADEWDAGRVGPEAFVPSRGAMGAGAAQQLSLGPEVAGFLAYAGLRPALEHLLAPARAHLDDGAWALGICPFCGAPPAFADIVEDGRRQLSCHLCGGAWIFSRVRCPLCGADASHDLVRLEPDGADEAYFISGCTRCKGYVKEIDRRQRWNAKSPLVEDWGSPHLDLIARREGYRRAVPTLLEVATPV